MFVDSAEGVRRLSRPGRDAVDRGRGHLLDDGVQARLDEARRPAPLLEELPPDGRVLQLAAVRRLSSCSLVSFFSNRTSSEQSEFIEPVAHVAGTVDSQDGSGLVM